MSALTTLAFDNRFTRALPADPEPGNHRRQVRGACFSRVAPTPVRAPQLIAWSAEMCAALGLPEPVAETPEFLEVFSGNRLLPGMDPHAMCYGGHQFGNWAGQLGDGRAINLGEVTTPQGRLALQLKGAGATPYSRTADGLAVLRSSVREFLCSEAMHHLGVPTTRALSLVTTGESVMRDMFYDGRPAAEPGAIVCRVAPSFLRFGNYEILTARREFDLLRSLADYTIANHFPDLDPLAPDRHSRWFRRVCELTCGLIVEWMRVGFVHGVMNTDNMSILGLTIDYGPYGWLEDFNPGWTPNTTDAGGRRYRFGHQAQIAQWNLLQLANAIAPLVADVAPLEEALSDFAVRYKDGWSRMMAAKLGVAAPAAGAQDALVDDLMLLLQRAETDMTLCFRGLADLAVSGGGIETLKEAFYDPAQPAGDLLAAWQAWLERWRSRLAQEGREPASVRAAMNRVNPRYVLRNYLAQLAIDRAEAGDPAGVRELLDVLRRPYDEQPGREAYAARRPDWARSRPGCSMLSCSS